MEGGGRGGAQAACTAHAPDHSTERDILAAAEASGQQVQPHQHCSRAPGAAHVVHGHTPWSRPPQHTLSNGRGLLSSSMFCSLMSRLLTPCKQGQPAWVRGAYLDCVDAWQLCLAVCRRRKQRRRPNCDTHQWLDRKCMRCAVQNRPGRCNHISTPAAPDVHHPAPTMRWQ